MTQQKRKKTDRAYYTFGMLMLSVVLVFVFGVIVGKQNHAGQDQTVHADRASVRHTEDGDGTGTTETLTASDGDAGVRSEAKTENPDEPVPEYAEATDFWSMYPHVYLRVNHEKQLELGATAGFDLSGAQYGVDDESVLVIDDTGNITGLTKGECNIIISCNEQTLHIPVTVRELTVRDECTYVDDILIVNKTYGLPESYDPGMLPETAEAFAALQEAAAALGLDIYEGSGYRTYAFQVDVYESMCQAYGEEYARMVSARPGFSEHQTGYTVDCNTINNNFAETDEGKWLENHCHEYGFIIRYPLGKETITGYDYESWHIRYVGVEAATEIYEQGLCLEEYLDVESIHPEDMEAVEDYIANNPEAANREFGNPEEDTLNSPGTDNPENPDTENPDATSQANPGEFADAPAQAPV